MEKGEQGSQHGQPETKQPKKPANSEVQQLRPKNFTIAKQVDAERARRASRSSSVR